MAFEAVFKAALERVPDAVLDGVIGGVIEGVPGVGSDGVLDAFILAKAE